MKPKSQISDLRVNTIKASIMRNKTLNSGTSKDISHEEEWYTPYNECRLRFGGQGRSVSRNRTRCWKDGIHFNAGLWPHRLKRGTSATFTFRVFKASSGFIKKFCSLYLSSTLNCWKAPEGILLLLMYIQLALQTNAIQPWPTLLLKAQLQQ